VGKLMAITTLFAGLFGVMTWLGTPPVVFAAIAVFFALVGLAQAILFQGRRPRQASVVAGIALCELSVVGFVIAMIWIRGIPSFFELSRVLVTLLLVMLCCGPIGAGLGYLAGCVIAAVFLRKQSESEDTEEHRAEPAYSPFPDKPTDISAEQPDE
jgi:hypothetical protein